MVAGVVWSSRNARIGWNDASFGALVAAFPNTGFMGVPLLVALLGAPAAGPAILTILIDLVVTSSLCIALSRLDGADEHGAAMAAKKALQGRGAQPDAVVHRAGRRWPRRCTGARSAGGANHRAAGRCRLAGGAVHDRRGAGALAVRARRRENTGPCRARDFVPVALAKLLVHPLLVWGAGSGAMALGLPLGRFALTVMVLVAALASRQQRVAAGRALRRRHRAASRGSSC